MIANTSPVVADRSPGGYRLRRSKRAASSTKWPLVIAAVASVVIVLAVGAATNWFWYASAPSSGGGGGGGGGHSGPGPNPYNETISAVYSSVTYNGASSGYFAALDGKDLCGPCPTLPTTDYNYTPAVSGFWFYFNVTSSASAYVTLSNFTVTTRGSDPALFTLSRVVCCSPSYSEVTIRVGFTPGAEMNLAAFVYAASIPDVGPAGMALYFNATSP
ncbi:MAG: hypothetical protein ACLP74_04185 [Thermoplasmata archaeon]